MFGSNFTSNTGFGNNQNTSFGSNNGSTGSAFGATNNATGFGANNAQNNNTAFGQPQQTSLFGGQPQQGTSLFGQNQNQTQNQAQTGTAFGGFGQPQQQQAQPSQGSGLFGSSSNTGTGLFGSSSTTNTGTANSGGFGGSSAFGASNQQTAGPFGATGQAQQGGQGGTAVTPYQPKQENDPTRPSTTNVYHSISAMPQYANSSFEELRLQDYQQNRRYGNNGSAAPTASFGTASTTTNAFGSNTGTTTGGFGFGQQNQANTAMSSPFGASNANAGTSMFGQNNSQQTGTGFGQTSSPFGQQNNTAFGQNKPATGGFGFNASTPQTATTGTGLFGQNNNQTQQTSSPFGQNNNNTQQSTGFGFGLNKPAATSFGATSTGFGSTAGSTTNTGFGGFGQNNQNTQTNTGTGLFGQSTQNQGASTFGQTNNQSGGSLFGQNKSAFGQPAASTGFGFGTNNTNQNTTGLNSNAASTPSLFGQNNQSTGNTGTSLFGQNNSATTSFGQTNAPKPGGLFGSSTTNQPASTFGSGFGQTQPQAGGFGQTQQQQGSSLFGNNSAASNTGSSLFGNKPAAATSTGFGSTSTSLFGNNSAANTTAPSTGLFGAKPAAPATTGSSFSLGPSTLGTGATPATNNSSGLFGNAANKPATTGLGGPTLGTSTGTLGGGFNLGGQTTSAGGLFGNKTAAPVSSGLSFGSANTGLNPSVGSTLNSNQGLVANIGQRNPYSSNPLFDTANVNPGQVQQEPFITPLTQSEKDRKSDVLIAMKMSPRPLMAKKQIEVARRTSVTARELPAPDETKKNKKDSQDLLYSTETDRIILMSEAFAPRSSARQLIIGRAHDESTLGDKSLREPDTPQRALPDAAASSTPLNLSRDFSPERVLAATSTPQASTDRKKDEDIVDENGYWISPSQGELSKMSLRELSSVNGFRVGRKGDGFIEFNAPIDLSNYSNVHKQVAGHIVKFAARTVALYPEPTIRPPRGEGFNIPATVTLNSVWDKAGSLKKGGSNPKQEKRIAKFRSHLEAMPNTKFVSWDSQTGSWVFSIDAQDV